MSNFYAQRPNYIFTSAYQFRVEKCDSTRTIFIFASKFFYLDTRSEGFRYLQAIINIYIYFCPIDKAIKLRL
jgi:hypothetical protein